MGDWVTFLGDEWQIVGSEDSIVLARKKRGIADLGSGWSFGNGNVSGTALTLLESSETEGKSVSDELIEEGGYVGWWVLHDEMGLKLSRRFLDEQGFWTL